MQRVKYELLALSKHELSKRSHEPSNIRYVEEYINNCTALRISELDGIKKWVKIYWLGANTGMEPYHHGHVIMKGSAGPLVFSCPEKQKITAKGGGLIETNQITTRAVVIRSFGLEKRRYDWVSKPYPLSLA